MTTSRPGVRTAMGDGTAWPVVLLALLLTLGVGAWWSAHQVETTLTGIGTTRLTDAGIAATVDYDGRIPRVRAESLPDLEAARAELASVPGSRPMVIEGSPPQAGRGLG